MLELRKIDTSNIWEVIDLKVNDNQKGFVATNTQSIIEAYAALSSGHVALPFGIYDNEELIGFVMFGYGATGEEGEPKIANGNYILWRFMIDKNYQGKGYGKAALVASLDYLRTMPCGFAEYCWLSYEPDNALAKSLYTSMGFKENGEMCGDEIVSVIKL